MISDRHARKITQRPVCDTFEEMIKWVVVVAQITETYLQTRKEGEEDPFFEESLK